MYAHTHIRINSQCNKAYHLVIRLFHLFTYYSTREKSKKWKNEKFESQYRTNYLILNLKLNLESVLWNFSWRFEREIPSSVASSSGRHLSILHPITTWTAWQKEARLADPDRTTGAQRSMYDWTLGTQFSGGNFRTGMKLGEQGPRWGTHHGNSSPFRRKLFLGFSLNPHFILLLQGRLHKQANTRPWVH